MQLYSMYNMHKLQINRENLPYSQNPKQFQIFINEYSNQIFKYRWTLFHLNIEIVLEIFMCIFKRNSYKNKIKCEI